jgi:hypothetical protein
MELLAPFSRQAPGGHEGSDMGKAAGLGLHGDDSSWMA